MQECTKEIKRRVLKRNCETALCCAVRDYILHIKAAGRATQTILCYRCDLERLIGILGNIEMRNIKDNDLNKAIIQLTYSGTCIKRSVVTMNRLKSVYRTFFKWAFETERIRLNPAKFLLLARTSSRPTIPITIDETAGLLETIRKSSDPLASRDEALFATYAFTGIRRSEALALRLKDYDPHTLTIFLPKIKGGGTRMQPIPSCLARILNNFLYKLRDRSDNKESAVPLFHGRHHKKYDMTPFPLTMSCTPALSW